MSAAAAASRDQIHTDIEPFVMTRTFNAPRDVVWKAWTEPKRLMEWWGPKGFTMKSAKVDLKPGGMYLYAMAMPNGSEMWGRFLFREIAAPERLVYVNSFSNARGEVTRHPMHKEWPLELLTTITFEDLCGARTQVTINWMPINAAANERKTFDDNRPSMTGGWTGTMDKLETYLAEKKDAPMTRSVVHGDFTIERNLDHPPAAVFRAFTDNDAKAKWFAGSEDWTLMEREMDVRAGGRERLKGRWKTGTVTEFDARYFDIVANERLVYAYEMHIDDKKISVSLATVSFVAKGSGTVLTITEQGTFLDGYDDAGSRERGTRQLIETMAASLERSA